MQVVLYQQSVRGQHQLLCEGQLVEVLQAVRGVEELGRGQMLLMLLMQLILQEHLKVGV